MTGEQSQFIVLKQCSFAYDSGAFRLDPVSLSIRLGCMYGIVGPNGSGKSTLLRIMAGLIRPERGEVSVKGRLIGQYSRLELARELAFLPQQPSSSFDLKARDAVGLGRYPYQPGFGLLSRHDEEVIDRIMRETECERLADRYLSTLSGGERQRVMIASILAQEPALLLLDEPGSALDIHHKSHVFDLLWQLARNGMAVVMVTHDLNLASEFCDELMLMADGRVVETGSPLAVMRNDTLSTAYETELRVAENPFSGSPMVNVVSRKADSVGDRASPVVGTTCES